MAHVTFVGAQGWVTRDSQRIPWPTSRHGHVDITVASTSRMMMVSIPPDHTQGRSRPQGGEGGEVKNLMTWLKPKPNRPESVRRIWDRERSRAMSPSHRDEIDAIFSRYL